jgi:hypothetical protein
VITKKTELQVKVDAVATSEVLRNLGAVASKGEN